MSSTALHSATICQPHWERWARRVPASVVVADEPMCRGCFSGKSGMEDELRERRAAMKASWANPEARAKRRAAMKASWANPEVRAKRRAAQKAAWANPEARAKRRAAMNRPEVRAKLRAAQKAAWANPEVRAKRRAAMKNSWSRRRRVAR